MKNLNPRLFIYVLVAVFFIEIFSLLGYLVPALNTAFFFILVLITLVVSLKNLEAGLYIALVELFIGSKGYLFSWNLGNLVVSLRLALFLIVFFVWLLGWLRGKKFKFTQLNLFKWYILLLFFIAWGVVNAFLKDTPAKNIFFDVNGYLYLGLFFVFFTVFNSLEKIKKLLTIMLASVVAMAAKSILLLYIFSHQMFDLMPPLYRWVRITGIGEIALVGGKFYRVFFQSHLYSIFVFLIVFIFFLFLAKGRFSFKNYRLWWITLLLASLTVILSFSRSLWLGLAGGLFFLYLFLFFLVKYPPKKILLSLGLLILLFGVSLGLLLGIVNVPTPFGWGSGVGVGLIKERLTEVEEPAATSRWNLLQPLFQENKKYPVLGAGFGHEVSFVTEDPNYIKLEGTNIRKTWAFEWTFLDLWLKMGIFGLLAYLIFIGVIFKNGWQVLKKKEGEMKALALGFLIGLIALFFVNITTPYYNHPLGIGFLLISAVVFEVLKKEESLELTR